MPRKNGNVGNVTLTIKWAQNTLKSLDWVKRRGSAGKRDESSIVQGADFFLK